jgi:uncharacterized protein YggE
MKQKLFFTLISLLSVHSLAACTFSTDSPSNFLNVNGTGKVYIVPDIAYISIGVRNKSAVVGDALSENNKAAQAISEALKKQGVEADDIQTSAFNVYPEIQYDPQTGQETKTLYVVDNSVMVTARNLQNLGEILDVVVGSGANTINGISFDIADKTEALSEARRLAVDDAKKQAAELAQAAGITLGKITQVNVYYNGAPMTVYEGKGMAAGIGGGPVPVAAGQMIIQMDSNISYEIK